MASFTPLSNHRGSRSKMFTFSRSMWWPGDSMWICCKTSEDMELGHRCSKNLALRERSISVTSYQMLMTQFWRHYQRSKTRGIKSFCSPSRRTTGKGGARPRGSGFALRPGPPADGNLGILLMKVAVATEKSRYAKWCIKSLIYLLGFITNTNRWTFIIINL